MTFQEEEPLNQLGNVKHNGKTMAMDEMDIEEEGGAKKTDQESAKKRKGEAEELLAYRRSTRGASVVGKVSDKTNKVKLDSNVPLDLISLRCLYLHNG